MRRTGEERLKVDAAATIRAGYAALGLGTPPAVLAMFEQCQSGQGPCWRVHDLLSAAVYRSRPVVALDLFGGLPSHWELTGIEVRTFHKVGSTLVASGRFRCRPKGSWEPMSLPFAHIWAIPGGRVAKVTSYLDGIEISRQSDKDHPDANLRPRLEARRRHIGRSGPYWR